MEITNTVRQRVWRQQPRGFLREAFIDTDGTVAPTFGECKGGMALSYKGIWGYAPLVLSLANTNEVLYLVNRCGNVVSHEGCVPWIDRAIKLVAPHAGQITLRGDTDFTLTGELDRWDEQGVKFIFGMDAHPKVVNLAEALPEQGWKPLERECGSSRYFGSRSATMSLSSFSSLTVASIFALEKSLMGTPCTIVTWEPSDRVGNEQIRPFSMP